MPFQSKESKSIAALVTLLNKSSSFKSPYQNILLK